MKLKGIILDVDGTIADTEEIHRQAFNLTFKEFELDWHWSVDDYRELLSISGGKERFKICLNKDKELKAKIKKPIEFIQSMHSRKSEIYRSLLADKSMRLRPGIERLINEAIENKVRLGIATSSSTANLKTLINNTLDKEPEELFNHIVTCDTVSDKKPSPIVYQCALSSLGFSPEYCIAIEDTFNGNQAAINAGLNTVITTHEYTKADDFTGAALVVNHLGEPDESFTVSQGETYDKSYVDLDLLDNILLNQDIELSEISEYENVAMNVN